MFCKLILCVTWSISFHETRINYFTPLQDKWFLTFWSKEYLINFLWDNLTLRGCHLCFYYDLSWWPPFVNFISVLITMFCLCLGISEVGLWTIYDNLVLHRLPIFRLPLTHRLILKRILRTWPKNPC